MENHHVLKEKKNRQEQNPRSRIHLFLLLRYFLDEVEHSLCVLLITFIFICAFLCREWKLLTLFTRVRMRCCFVLQVSEPGEQCEGATQAFHFWHKKARCARQNICIEILARWCLASWCTDYCICLTVISLRKSIGISITKRDFKDDEYCSYIKCQWLLNCISYF